MTWNKFFQKITRDILIAFLITYFFLLIPEIVLPGIVSSHFSPKYFLVLVLAVAGLHTWLSQKNLPPENNLRFRTISKNILNAILFVIAAMLILSLYKMSVWEIVVTVALSMGLLVSTGKMLLEEEK
jgi:cell division protein FtsW (lipid II flippase)